MIAPQHDALDREPDTVSDPLDERAEIGRTHSCVAAELVHLVGGGLDQYDLIARPAVLEGRFDDEGVGRAHRRDARGAGPRDGVEGMAHTVVLGAVRDEGSFVTTLPTSVPSPERGIQVSSVQVEADGDRLGELVSLAEQGKLALRVAQTYDLHDAARAHARLEKGGVRGRLVLTP